MKRLIPLLILAAFCLGIANGGVSRSDVHHKICTHHQNHPQLSFFFLFEDHSGDWQAANQPVALPGNIVYTPTYSRHALSPWKCPGQILAQQYVMLGLGCGGLPS
jgi:hypothetical protein